MTRKVLYISGTRADYGFMRGVLQKIHDHPDLELEIAVTGMHLMREFGYTCRIVEKDGFVIHKIPAKYNSSEESAVIFLGSFLKKMADMIGSIQPDIILVAGDRAEMLGGAITASYCSLPLAHISGGDVTSTIDEHIRHAITKLAHIHFPYTKLSAERIYKMGEDRSRIYLVGSPGVYQMLNTTLMTIEDTGKRFNLDMSRPFVIMIQHPVTFQADYAASQIRTTLDALMEKKLQTVIVYPNADNGGSRMIEVIREFEGNPDIRTYRTIPSREFFSLMKYATALVGNSSSGIVEAPSLKLPVINIGTRQEGREQADNVINVGYKKEEILHAIDTVLCDTRFQKKVRGGKNPYDAGDAASKIADVLATVKINHTLLQKKLRY